MADLIIKPAAGAGNKLILQDQGGGVVLTTTDTGVTMQGIGGTDWVEVRTDNFQLEVNKNYMIDSGSLTGLPMNLIMPSSAIMGDRLTLIDATKTSNSNTWIINPNGLSIQSPGNGTSTWNLSQAAVSLQFIYFVSTRNSSYNEWLLTQTSWSH